MKNISGRFAFTQKLNGASSSLVAAEPLGVDLVVGAVGADFVEGLVKTGAQLVVALADGKAVVFRLQDTGHFAQVEVGGGLLSQEVLVDGLVVDDGLAALVVEFKEGFTRRIEGADFGALDLGHEDGA